MPITTENLARISAVSDMHTKILRAIGAGSQRIFSEFQKRHATQGTGLVCNFFELEKHDERTLRLNTKATIKNRRDGLGLSLSMSVNDIPEKCGVALSVFAHDKASDGGQFYLNVMCTLTAEYTERWNITVNGEWPTIIGDLGVILREVMTESIPELEALKLVRTIVNEHEKHLWPTRKRA